MVRKGTMMVLLKLQVLMEVMKMRKEVMMLKELQVLMVMKTPK